MSLREDDPIVMVVDDERDFLLMTKRLLERNGFNVEARTRAPSWRELLRIEPALILMDVMLEGENGSDVCRAIKSHKRLARLPIILISGHGEDRLQKEVNYCKADGFLTKPIKGAVLLHLAEHYVNRFLRHTGRAPMTRQSEARTVEDARSASVPPSDPALQRRETSPVARGEGPHMRAGEEQED